MVDSLPWHHWWAKFEGAPTSPAAFAIFLVEGVEILERAAPLVSALHGASGDPEAAAVWEVSERRRVEAYREVVRLLAHKSGGLKAELTPAKATDIMVVLFSAELYQSIRIGRGWSKARTASFLHDLLAAQLLGD